MKLKCLSWLRGGGGGGGGCLVWPVDVAPEPLVTELDLLGVGGGLEAGLGGGRGLGPNQVQGVDGHVAPVALVHAVIPADKEKLCSEIVYAQGLDDDPQSAQCTAVADRKLWSRYTSR